MQTVLVTGASSGMGKATAKKLSEAGYPVCVAARRLDQMRDLAELGAMTLAMDITIDEEIVAVVERIAAERGGIDVLINNAGFAIYGAMEDTTSRILLNSDRCWGLTRGTGGFSSNP